jgi:hypothetical protein
LSFFSGLRQKRDLGEGAWRCEARAWRREARASTCRDALGSFLTGWFKLSWLASPCSRLASFQGKSAGERPGLRSKIKIPQSTFINRSARRVNFSIGCGRLARSSLPPVLHSFSDEGSAILCVLLFQNEEFFEQEPTSLGELRRPRVTEGDHWRDVPAGHGLGMSMETRDAS